MNTEINIEELERLAKAATSGPWRRQDFFCGHERNGINDSNDGCICSSFGGRKRPEDFDFIAAANPSAVLALIDRLKKSEADLERERIRLAACGVVALADTPESAARARNMREEYRSASCDDVARMADQVMALRAERDAVAAYDTNLIDQTLRESLGDAYDCTRVWNAWGYGTMGPDDFALVSDNDERIAEIREAVLAALPAPAGHPVNQRLLEALDKAHMALIGYFPEHRNSFTDAAIESARNASTAAHAIQKATPLEPVVGDLLPPIGSTVLIHLSSQDAWVEHTVTGYYAWGDLSGNPRLQRVFVRVVDADGTRNARMLCDVKRADGDFIVAPIQPSNSKESEDN